MSFYTGLGFSMIICYEKNNFLKKLKVHYTYINHNKSDILYKFILQISFVNFFSIYVKRAKKLSAKYYHENKERLQEKACERYQNLSKEEKEKREDIVVNIKKISQKMRKIVEKDISNRQTKHLWLRNNKMFSTNPFIQFSNVSSVTAFIIKELLLD